MKTKIISLLLCLGMLVACNNTQKGAGIGAGIYKTPEEAFSTLKTLETIEPKHQDEYRAAYENWKKQLTK